MINVLIAKIQGSSTRKSSNGFEYYELGDLNFKRKIFSGIDFSKIIRRQQTSNSAQITSSGSSQFSQSSQSTQHTPNYGNNGDPGAGGTAGTNTPFGGGAPFN